jgi:hypothetical protein
LPSQRAAYRAQIARQRKLAGELEGVERIGLQLPAGRQDAQRNRQVETAGLLGQIGGRQVDRDAPVGKFELAVEQCRAHALAALADFGIGQPDDIEGGQAVREVDFDGDGRCLDSSQARLRRTARLISLRK